MTESEKAIRAALAAGPTPGPWKLHAKYLANVVDVNDRTCVVCCLDFPEAESDARFIAACNPTAITELLARLEAAEVDAARYRWLRNECGDAEIGVYIYARDPHRTTWAQDAALDAAIDAARAQEAT